MRKTRVKHFFAVLTALLLMLLSMHDVYSRLHVQRVTQENFKRAYAPSQSIQRLLPLVCCVLHADFKAPCICLMHPS
jgi:hypothetical protein